MKKYCNIAGGKIIVMYLRTQCWGGVSVGWAHQFRALCHQMVTFMQSLGSGGDAVSHGKKKCKTSLFVEILSDIVIVAY